MKKFPFQLTTDEDLILLTAWIGGQRVKLALDTAASHTVIDLNVVMMLAGFKPQAIGKREVETSNGIITVEEFKLRSLEVLGKTAHSFNR
jgi:Aspartyl protease